MQKKGDVLKVLKDLLAGMNLAVDQCIDTLVATLGDSASRGEAPPSDTAWPLRLQR